MSIWRNQLAGVESIAQFRVEELEVANATAVAADPSYVRARPILDDVDLFDAAFFGVYPKEAELMDPQQRIFLECCWEAIEDAGYDPLNCPAMTGVYAGCSPSTYFLRHVCRDRRFIEDYVGGYQVANYPVTLGSNLDFLATRVSYKLNLKGPAFTMVAGCSTSLLAACQAAQALQTYQCDMALAGGVSISFPQKRGYLYQEGGMVSPDGHCRTFDENANGTVFGAGAGVVLLKRLEDAVADGDSIYAVIRGFATNNDGSDKVGYTAPSVEGQANVIAMAQAMAGVSPDSIGYVEAHGTGTPLGDPIEMAALTKAFRAHTMAKQFCAVGTAKSNVGHLDIAAGITGLIHAAHVVRDGVFPPTLHFQKPNPKLDLENSPFFLNSKRKEWKQQNGPRRAGVSAFGVGGTNAHLILEQAPAREPSTSARSSTRTSERKSKLQLLVLSARSEAALENATANLCQYLTAHPDVNLADVAWTLQMGRHAFPCRRAIVARDVPEAIASLSALARQQAGASPEQPILSSLADSFSGEGDAASLTNSLGALWLAGAQPDWRSLHGEEKRQRISLPTYPFERKRYWLDAPILEDSAVALPVAPAATPRISEIPAEALASEENTQVNMNSQTLAATPVTVSRQAKITKVLNEIFEDLSGLDLSQADSSTSFLEMGFDSLFLTQATQSLQGKFGVKITFRQMLGDLASMSALSEYLDSKLPADVMAEAAPPAVTAPVVPVIAMSAISAVSSTPATTSPMGNVVVNGNGNSAMSESPVERLMREQLSAMSQLFAKQLEAMRGGAAAPASAVLAAAQVAPAPVVPATVAPKPSSPSPAPVVAPISASAAPSITASAKEEFKPFGPYKPPQKGTSGNVTPEQQAGLMKLIELYTRHTAKSKSSTEKNRAALADPRVVSGFRSLWKEIVYPIVTNRSQGSHLWDVDGNEYIDILNGFGPIMLGHRPDFVEQAIAKQLHEGFEIGPQTPLAGEVAQLFCQMTGNERMTFCNTGSESVMAALRVARTVTGRNKVVFFAGAYHGMFDEVLVKSVKKGGVPHSAPVAPGIPRENLSNVVVLDYGTAESLEWIRQNAKDLAAVLVEPVQSRHPHLQPREFLQEIRKITQESGAALIFDEVVTGFRVHLGGCQALFGIRADLATYGKVVAGGMPIGILAGKAAFMDALDGGTWHFGDDSYPEVGVTFFAGTFIRHPLTLAAMKAVMQHFQQQGPGLQERLTERTTKLVKTLNEFFELQQVPTRIEHFASIFYFALPTEERFASLFYYFLRMKGIHILEGFPCFLTTAHTDADLEKIVAAFKESVFDMQTAGFFAKPSSAEQATVTLAAAAEAGPELAREVPVEVPVTEPQLEVWLSDQLSDDASCAFNESFTLHMRGKVNEPALKDAVRQLINRHDALRATFIHEGQLQKFAPKLDLNIPTVDLTAISAAERDARWKQIIRDDAHTPFRLIEGPMVRAQQVKMEPGYTCLVFTAHHIVCDGWSTNVLLDELPKIYNALNRGESSTLPAPMSFGTYSKSQKEFMSGPEGANVEKFWLDQFQQPAPLLDLPTDRPRPAVKEFKGATYRTRIGADAYNAIKKLGAKQKCTLFVTLLSGFQMLLSRLSGQDDFVVGIPTAGQSLLEDAVLVGHCVNFIPLRGKPAADSTAAQFLAQMKQTVLSGYEHQNYTYGRLVRKLQIPRDPSRLPLTEVQFNLERVGGDMPFDGFQAEADPNPKSFVNFDIFLNIVESKDGLMLDCDYNTGLFDESTIARWLSHYETLLLGMVENADQPVARLPLLNEAGHRQLAIDWNQTAAAYPRNLCVHQLFEAQASKTPDAIAAVFESEQLTYRDLDRRANQLANYLRSAGVKPGVMVGVFVERSLDMIVALLGVMKAGGAYVPMDPTYPAERISFVLNDASVPILLTQESLFKTVNIGTARHVFLDTEWATIAKHSSDAPPTAPTADDLAYVIYTSGSTGKPKGVEIGHRAVVNLLLSMSKTPGLKTSDTLLAVTTLSFDIAGLELFLPLAVGARLVIASREAAADGNLLLSLIVSSKATVMQATPVTWKLLIEAGWEGKPALKVLCGGEAFPRDLANELVRRAQSVWNMYGPTETTIWSSTLEVKAGEGPVPIGPPIDNTQFYVLDAANQLVPVGVAGELHIGGDGLARGYFHRPELTAEKFVADLFRPNWGSNTDARMYKTGDLVRRAPDGTIEFLGRLDHQVKLRGFRIELGEIETALARYPGVREAVVIVREDTPGDKRLVAYVTSDQQAITVATVREALTGKLPNYMLPSAVVRLDAMPLTPNGKIDRKALPAPDTGRAAHHREFVAPRTEQEKTLAAIWAEVLHLERVGIQDNLFELGADSLHIFQIVARAGKAGMKIPPALILKHRTIAAVLAQFESGAASSAKAAPGIVAVSRERYRVKTVLRVPEKETVK